MENLEKYKQAFCESFEITEDKLHGLAYQAIPSWDSVGHMTLIAALEDEFDIFLEPEDMMALTTYKKGFEILRKYGVTFE